jgi:hypothetical protein
VVFRVVGEDRRDRGQCLAGPALALATAAGFAVAAATVLVIIGVRQEERRGTIENKRAPSIPALLARRVLTTYVRQLSEDQPTGRPVKPSER